MTVEKFDSAVFKDAAEQRDAIANCIAEDVMAGDPVSPGRLKRYQLAVATYKHQLELAGKTVVL